MIWKFIAVFSIILCKKCPKQFIFSIHHIGRGGATFSAKEQLTVNRRNTSARCFLSSFSSPSFVASPCYIILCELGIMIVWLQAQKVRPPIGRRWNLQSTPYACSRPIQTKSWKDDGRQANEKYRVERKKARHSLFPYFSTLFIFIRYDVSRDLIRMKIIYSCKSFQTYCAHFWDLLRIFLKLSYKRI